MKNAIELYNVDGECIGYVYSNGKVTINGKNYVSAGLADGHKKVLAFIMSYIDDNGKPPTYQEIGDFFGFSRERAHQIVVRLEKKGLIAREPKTRRSLNVTIGKEKE